MKGKGNTSQSMVPSGLHGNNTAWHSMALHEIDSIHPEGAIRYGIGVVPNPPSNTESQRAVLPYRAWNAAVTMSGNVED